MSRHVLVFKNVFAGLIAMTALNGCGGGEVSISVLPSSDQFQQKTNADVKIDILFVVDDSGSMKAEQQQMNDNFKSFINFFYDRGFDFRVAVAKTSAYGTTIACKQISNGTNRTCQNSTVGQYPYYKKNVNGEFIAGDYIARESGLTPKEFRCGYGNNCGLNGGPGFQSETSIPDTLDSDAELGTETLKTTIGNGTPAPTTDHILSSTQLSKDEMIKRFKRNILVGLAGSGDERALETAETVIRNMKQFYPDPNQQFPRPNSHLAVIHVGDEGDGPIPNNLTQGSVAVALTGSNSTSSWGSLRSTSINNLSIWPDYEEIGLVIPNSNTKIDDHLTTVRNYMDALKKHDLTTTMSVHAIQDLPSVSKIPYFLPSTVFDATGNSEFGLVGYYQAYMAIQSGGLVFSKDSNFGPSLSAIGDTISSLASFFELEEPLDEFAQQNLKVYVEGINGNNPLPKSSTNGYQYESETNRIRFYGSMIPPQGAIIGLIYTSSTLGN